MKLSMLDRKIIEMIEILFKLFFKKIIFEINRY